MKKNIFFITIDAERAMGLESLLDNYHIICYYDNHTFRMMRDRGFNIISIEDLYQEIEPIKKNSNAILNDTLVQEYISSNSDDPADTYIQVFKISPRIEKSIKDLGYQLLNTSAELNMRFEQKISQYQFLSNLDLKIPRSITGFLTDSDYRSLKKKVGENFVVQFNKGHTGTNTYIINNENDFDSLKRLFPQRPMKLSEYIEGEPWTMNCVATNLGIFYTGLTYQITGIPKLTNSEGATVGNDWTKSRDLKKETIEKIRNTASTVGSKMYKEGFKGLYGLDFIISENGEVTLIEINARQPASTGIDTQIVLEEDLIPVSLLHSAEFLSSSRSEFTKLINNVLKTSYSKEELVDLLKEQNSMINTGYNFSQFYIRNRYNRKARMHYNIPGGFYRSSKLTDQSGFKVTDLVEGQYYLTTIEKGRSIKPGGEVARVQVNGSCLTNRSIKKSYNDIINNIDSCYSPYQVTTLPEDVIKDIDQYFRLNFGGNLVKTPYFRNVKRIRAGLRVLAGKGSPEEIIDETKIFAKLKGVELDELKTEEIREFMSEMGIGVDCSGFVSQIYDKWLIRSTNTGIGKYMNIEKDTMMRRLKYYFRPIEHLDANTLTNDNNCIKIGLKDIQPGDLIRLRGAQRGFHILFVYSISREKNDIRSFRYVHSSPHYGKENGMRYGEVEITNINKGLREQKWLEVDRKSNKNFTYQGLLKDYEDNGIRRPKFISKLK